MSPMTTCDSWTRAGVLKAAVSAVRPPSSFGTHRGRRSWSSRSRRWCSWQSRYHHSVSDSCSDSNEGANVLQNVCTGSSNIDDRNVSHAFVNVREFAGEDGRVELACLASRSVAVVPAAAAGAAAVASVASAAVPAAASVARSSAALAASPARSLVLRAVPAAAAALAPTAGNVRRINQSTNSASMSVSTAFKLFHLNPRGLKQNLAQVTALVESVGLPHVIGFTETWGDRIEEKISGYHLISQLDRRTAMQGGGIALYALDGFQQNIAHFGDSEVDERSWFIIHADSGPILLCLWYRRPSSGETASVRRFDAELSMFSRHAVSCIVMGDMNVHNRSWLRFSSRDSAEGSMLEAICVEHGLRQVVSKPTRGPYLLDLVLTDLTAGVRCEVVKGIHANDHDGVITFVHLEIVASQPVERTVYDFRKADWAGLKLKLLEIDWRHTSAKSGDEAACEMVQQILDAVTAAIPSRLILDKVWAHPWLNDACRRALQRKRDAFGTSSFERCRDECSQAYLDAFASYVNKTRGELKELAPSSRGWWKLSSSLLQRAGARAGIPPLKRTDDTWALTPAERAEELAKVFRLKSQLPEAVTNSYTTLEPTVRVRMLRIPRLSVSSVHALLRGLDETSGTGPDRLPARVLKACAAELALPLTLLVRKLIREQCWPSCWRLHWIHAIHKKGAKAEGKNYRGVHLTAQLSKVVERAVGSLLLPWLEATGAYGPHQYAYTKKRSYKDVLAVNVCSWLLLLEQGLAVGVFCSDVSGAFDRVPRVRLQEKIAVTGVHADLAGFLASWLSDRVSQVVLGGAASAAEVLADSVFQGTVLGPPLWNAFFGDSRRALIRKDFKETVFADDLNAWRAFSLDKRASAPHETALSELAAVQRELHQWGAANQVVFDPSKESVHILHRSCYYGENFKILGCVFDPQLRMLDAAKHVAREAGWRLKTLLRTRKFFTTPELVHLYKAQILSYMESSTAALYHAAPTNLAWIDRVQHRFLKEIGLSELEAVRNFRLAPLNSRRDMAMLGLLHKINLGEAPLQLQALFPKTGLVPELPGRRRLRFWRPLHSKQLATPVDWASSEVLKRSLFGLVRCYNKLPQKLVDASTVKALQRDLQLGLLHCAELGLNNWQSLFSSGWKELPRTKFDSVFPA